MSSPVRLEQEQATQTYGPRRSTVATELLNVTQELNIGLQAEKANLTRDVLLWQRWVRWTAPGCR